MCTQIESHPANYISYPFLTLLDGAFKPVASISTIIYPYVSVPQPEHVLSALFRLWVQTIVCGHIKL